ncbi:MAG: ComEC/Rec2 family competence protein [Actinobacteria bacterium]|nr:ComEC/Rec2 family competence protein [Actinomycetota bacterium]
MLGLYLSLEHRRDVDERGRRRMQTRHVVGVLDVAAIGFPEGGVDARTRVLERTANDMRSLLSRGASVMRSEDSALFRGLVYGDDADQSVDTVNAFRASGLAHLTAVSGQNVGYLLTVLGPFLRRRERWARVIITLSALGWFAVLTRLEPSVVRAAGMAAISALSMAFGWRARALDVLSLCVVVFVMVDPFLVWSVGWWLSVGGTLGLITLTPFIHRLVRGTDGRHRRLADWVAPTIAAQAGVLPVSFAVFGWPNALSVPANLLAAPVAGLVMLVGFPAAMLAGLVPVLAEPLMFFPSLAVRWVALVAAVASRWRPPDMVNVIGIVLIPLTLWMVARTSRHRCANLG